MLCDSSCACESRERRCTSELIHGERVAVHHTFLHSLKDPRLHYARKKAISPLKSLRVFLSTADIDSRDTARRANQHRGMTFAARGLARVRDFPPPPALLPLRVSSELFKGAT